MIREDTGVWLDATKGHDGKPGWFEFADPSKPLSRSYVENLSIDISDRIHRWTNKMINTGFFDIGTRPNTGDYYHNENSYGFVSTMELFPLWLADTGVPVSKMDDNFMRKQYLIYRKQNNDAWELIQNIGMPMLFSFCPGVTPTPSVMKPPPAPEYYKSNNPYYPVKPVAATNSPNPGAAPTGPVFNPAGAARAAKFNSFQQGASLSETVRNIAGDNPVTTYTASGKTVYTNPSNGMQVVYDNTGNYFRVEDTTVTGPLRYTDQFGKPIPANVPLIKQSGTTQTGVPSDVRNALTHFTNTD